MIAMELFSAYGKSKQNEKTNFLGLHVAHFALIFRVPTRHTVTELSLIKVLPGQTEFAMGERLI